LFPSAIVKFIDRDILMSRKRALVKSLIARFLSVFAKKKYISRAFFTGLNKVVASTTYNLIESKIISGLLLI